MRTVDFPIVNSTAISFRRVSLVRMASAARRALVTDLASNGAHARIPHNPNKSKALPELRRGDDETDVLHRRRIYRSLDSVGGGS